MEAPGWIVSLAYATDPDPRIHAALIAISGRESSWNPNAIGDGGASFGLMQFYTRGGLGDGHAPADLLDPGYNFRLAASYIRGRLASGASLYDALSPWTTRDLAWPDIVAMLGQAAGATGAGSALAGESNGGLVLGALMLAALWLWVR